MSANEPDARPSLPSGRPAPGGTAAMLTPSPSTTGHTASVCRLVRRPGCGPRALLHLAGAAGVVLVAAVQAAEPARAAAPVVDPAPAPVPGIPVAADIEGLSPIDLRREISRAEGRITDLRKARQDELAGLDAATARAQSAIEQARAAAQSVAMAPPGSGKVYAATPPASAAASDLLNAGTRTERRQAIARRYTRLLAEAQARLERLLDRQAQIDPEAPDQQRLRHAGNPDTAVHWPEPGGG